MTPQYGRFIELLTREQFNIAEACLLIAQDAYPELNVDAYLRRIEAIAEGVRARIPADAFAEQRIVALNNYLFGELRLSGNVADYYDPRNSYLNEVIDRCKGIPITLCVLYIEVGRRIGLALKGVSFPGHFLVKLRVKRGQLVIDPFSRGEPQSEVDLRKRLQQVLPKTQVIESIEPYIEAATPREIIARLLRNLKGIYMKSRQFERALAVMNRIMLVNPESVEELRDRGLVYQQLECFRPALADLHNYLRRLPDAPDAQEIHERLIELRHAAGRLN
jgi:regulator of sirC expression with transglutaminase-like and TPR domain